MRHALTLLFAALVLGQGPSPAAAQAPKSRVHTAAYCSPDAFDTAYGEMGAAGWSSRLGRSGRSPYTDDDDAYTTRATRARRAASSTWSVPVTLFALAPRGSFTDRGTDRIAAWWKTTPTPRVARSTTARCRMSPRTTSSRRPNALAKGRLLRAPVEKLSSTRTRAPSARSRSTRWEPMKPAPPVDRKSVV